MSTKIFCIALNAANNRGLFIYNRYKGAGCGHQFWTILPFTFGDHLQV